MAASPLAVNFFQKTTLQSNTELHTVVFLDANLPLASAPPSWSHLYEQAEQAASSTHEQLLLGNPKTVGDWGCLAARRVARVK